MQQRCSPKTSSAIDHDNRRANVEWLHLLMLGLLGAQLIVATRGRHAAQKILRGKGQLFGAGDQFAYLLGRVSNRGEIARNCLVNLVLPPPS